MISSEHTPLPTSRLSVKKSRCIIERLLMRLSDVVRVNSAIAYTNARHVITPILPSALAGIDIAPNAKGQKPPIGYKSNSTSTFPVHTSCLLLLFPKNSGISFAPIKKAPIQHSLKPLHTRLRSSAKTSGLSAVSLLAFAPSFIPGDGNSSIIHISTSLSLPEELTRMAPDGSPLATIFSCR